MRPGFWLAPSPLGCPQAPLPSPSLHVGIEAGRLPHSPDFSHELGFPVYLWKLLWGLPVPRDLTFHDDVALWVFLLLLCWELGGPFQSAKLCHLAWGFLELFPFSLFFLELLLVKY